MSTLNEQTFGQEKPYKAEQDGAREQLLDEIAEALRLPEPPPGSFTANDMAKRWETNIKAARQRLEKLYEQGVVDKKKIESRVYYRMKDGKDG